jgi:hypothetical protein
VGAFISKPSFFTLLSGDKEIYKTKIRSINDNNDCGGDDGDDDDDDDKSQLLYMEDLKLIGKMVEEPQE